MKFAAMALAGIVALGGCGGESGLKTISVAIDRERCQPPCTIDHYELWLHRSNGSGGGCTLQLQRNVTASITVPLPDDPSSVLQVGLAAFCGTSATARCCGDLAACLKDRAPTGAACLAANGSCPQLPSGNLQQMQSWYDLRCRADCVRCAGLTPFRYDASPSVSLVLKAATACAAPELLLPKCE